ncbi:hypothetical protein [Dysosmobacter welbionis]
MNLQIKDIINEIRPVVINKKRTELDARHDIGRVLAPGGISHSGPGGNRQLWPDENSQS